MTNESSLVSGVAATATSGNAANDPRLSFRPPASSLHASVVLLAYGAFSMALEHWEATRVSALLSLTPLTTLAMAWAGSRLFPAWVPPEELTLPAMLGAFLVVAGSAAVALGRRA